jgi:ABC-2 type transport system permease protein
MYSIFKREFRGFFETPIGYVFMGLFLLISGFFFAYNHLFTGSAYYSTFLGSIFFIFIFAVPLLTMKLLSEERRQKTDQLLLTCPISVLDIVLGKFFAAAAVFLMTLLVTVLYAVVVGIFGDLAVAETVGAYIGFFLLGLCFISIGLLVSALTENQVTAAFFTFFSLLFVWLLNLVKQVVPSDSLSGIIFAVVAGLAIVAYLYFNTRSWLVAAAAFVILAAAIVLVALLSKGAFNGFIGNVLGWISLIDRYNSFNLGILKLDAVVYYLSFSSVFLFLTVRVIEKRRWA